MTILTIDSIKKILSQRNRQSVQNPIFLLDENDGEKGDCLSDFIFNKVAQLNIKTFPCRFGILYKYESHVTPLLIEVDNQNRYDADTSISTYASEATGSKVEEDSSETSSEESLERSISSILSQESTNEEKGEEAPELVIRIFNTDSRAFDLAGFLGERLRANLVNIVQKGFQEEINVELYATGLLIGEFKDRVNTIRQHTDGHCGIFSLLDLETMFSIKSLLTFFSDKREVNQKEFGMIEKWNEVEQKSTSKRLEDDLFGHTRLYHISLLPEELMFYTQSVEGDLYGERKGIKHYIENKGAKKLRGVDIEYQSPELSPVKQPVVNPHVKLGDEDSIVESEAANKLWSFILQNTSAGKGHFDIKVLYDHLRDKQFRKNFTFDALCYMYESVSKHAPLDGEDYNLLRWSKEDLEKFLNNEFTPKQKRGNSPLQVFGLFSASASAAFKHEITPLMESQIPMSEELIPNYSFPEPAYSLKP